MLIRLHLGARMNDQKLPLTKGKYIGWVPGEYSYSNETKSLIPIEESKAYWERFDNWVKELEEKNSRNEHDTSFIGIDGIEYNLAPGLEGILENYNCIKEACKRFRDGRVTWEDLKSFLTYFPYSKPHPPFVRLSEKGNIHPIDSGASAHPREIGILDVCAMHSYISFDQVKEIYKNIDTLYTLLKSSGNELLWSLV